MLFPAPRQAEQATYADWEQSLHDLPLPVVISPEDGRENPAITLLATTPLVYLQTGEAASVRPNQMVGSYGATTCLTIYLCQDPQRLVMHINADFDFNLETLLSEAGFLPHKEIQLQLMGAASISSEEIEKEKRKEYCNLRLLYNALEIIKTRKIFIIRITHASVLDRANAENRRFSDLLFTPDGKILNICSLRKDILSAMHKNDQTTQFIKRIIRRMGIEEMQYILRVAKEMCRQDFFDRLPKQLAPVFPDFERFPLKDGSTPGFTG